MHQHYTPDNLAKGGRIGFRQLLFLCLLIVIISTVGLTSCTEPNPFGSITLQLQDNISIKTLTKGLYYDDDSFETIYSPGYGNALKYFDITFTGPDGSPTTYEKISLPDNKHIQENLVPGKWKIEVLAYDSSENYRGEGSVEVTIEAEESKAVTLPIGFAGTCDVNLSVTWPDEEFSDVNLTGSITKNYGTEDSEETTLSFSLDSEARTAATALEDIDSGVYYLKLSLKDGETLLWYRYAMMYLDKGTNTTLTHTLTDENIHLKTLALTISNELPDRYDLAIITQYNETAPFCSLAALGSDDKIYSLGSSLETYSWTINGAADTGHIKSTLPLSTLTSPGKYDIMATAKIDGNMYTTGRRIIIAELPRIKTVAFTPYNKAAFVLGTDGTMISWGKNDDWDGSLQFLQHGNTTNTATPKSVVTTELQNADDLDLGSYFGMIVKDKKLIGWGRNAVGSLGNDTTTDSAAPVEPQLPENFSLYDISVSDNHVLATHFDSSYGFKLYGWGYDYDDCLAGLSGEDSEKVLVPTLIPGIEAPKYVAAGTYHSLAVNIYGDLYAWGHNFAGQLGVGGTSTDKVSTPTKITSFGDVKITAIVASENMSFAITEDKDLYGWGWNLSGSIGDGTTTKQTSPKKILTGNVEEVVCGDDFALARKTDGSIWAWGSNSYGQLGNGTFTSSTTPIKIFDADTITGMWAGKSSAAIETFSGLYVWGRNDEKQLGLGYKTPIVSLGWPVVEGGVNRPTLLL